MASWSGFRPSSFYISHLGLCGKRYIIVQVYVCVHRWGRVGWSWAGCTGKRESGVEQGLVTAVYYHFRAESTKDVGWVNTVTPANMWELYWKLTSGAERSNSTTFVIRRPQTDRVLDRDQNSKSCNKVNQCDWQAKLAKRVGKLLRFGLIWLRALQRTS